MNISGTMTMTMEVGLSGGEKLHLVRLETEDDVLFVEVTDKNEFAIAEANCTKGASRIQVDVVETAPGDMFMGKGLVRGRILAYL
jgi:hypothetical protein